LSDINYDMPGTPATFHDPCVRQLTIADLDLLNTAPAELQGTFWNSNRDLLENSFAAGAIIGGRLVATACCSSLTCRYADIGVNTLPEYRNRGFATAAASLTARAIHDAGRTPVWSTGGHNLTSQRIAAKLGFTEVLRETYVLLENSPGFSNGKDTP
jgi:RimJ/RimL family protein N-acetyltransferase